MPRTASAIAQARFVSQLSDHPTRSFARILERHGPSAWYNHPGVFDMKLRDRSRLVLATTTLCLTAACGPSVAGSGTEGESEGTTGTTGGSTNPNTTAMTTTPDPSVGTGDVTGDPSSTTAQPTTSVDDTTAGGSDSCCEAHTGPGCNEEAVVDCVCAIEATCCAFDWDQVCVDLAMGKCMATCEEPPGSTTDEPGSTTDEPMGVCNEIVQFEMVPSEATHSGAWELGMSMVGEGEISVLNQMMGEDGSILYEPDIPCDDTWYIWVRYWEDGSEDSYFATLDGQPMPEAIFEGDCTGFGGGYDWKVLNWRDPVAGGPCDYVADPWAPDWTAGVHPIEFTFRESLAMGRILITNDETYVPM
jgi:hypothetical protein